ncbi:4-coumarate--CoA ligase family protein, partial [Acinetobacter baumannii]
QKPAKMSSSQSNDGEIIYKSPRPPISLPQDANISLVTFLFRNISSLSNTTALIDAETGKILTFSDLKTQVAKLSNALINLNISKSDVVLIFSPNSILFPISFFAVVSIGAIATTANPQYTISELSKQINDAKPKLIITTHQLYHKTRNFNLPSILLTPKNSSPRIINTTSKYPVWYYSDLVEIESFLSPKPQPIVVQSDVAALLYSSGTTGTSKGVVLTHMNFIAAALVATSDQELYGDDKNVFLCFLPLFHNYGFSAILYAQLQRGNTVVVMEKYEMKKMLRAIERYKVTHLYIVPPVVLALVREPDAVGNYDISSLKEIVSGAAPLEKELMEECAMIFPKTAILQAYGMTETCGAISLENARRISVGLGHRGSTGELASGFEAQIIHVDTLKPLPPFHNGEIWVRGPPLMQGYYKNSKATEEVIDKNGWLHTGDLGYFDVEGRLYIVDRLKELIKCKGFQVAPAELEELLLSHPEITDAAIIPFPDTEAGEVPIAFVVRSTNSSLSEQDVQNFIAQQVAPFKRLRRVTFLDIIPKSVSGKILRKELKHNLISKI